MILGSSCLGEDLFKVLITKEGGTNMANQAIIAKKEEIVNEIAERVKNANSVVLFDYRGLTD